MTTYKTKYKIVEGLKEVAELEIAKLAKEEFIWCGSITTTKTKEGLVHSLLMMKTEEVE